MRQAHHNGPDAVEAETEKGEDRGVEGIIQSPINIMFFKKHQSRV